ncbi:unnamed protein product [Angiostrongylus costaricensis]|uniref:MOSC domain-containing protein n=1 Tax=Angiostrongylus costaricensis TaxID=334426 RepID=A0A158PLJ2_ANGCS|nr:unnamed protein product [Angiostrongylus costaricensis]
MLAKDRNTIISVIGASVLIYKVVSRLWSYFRSRSHDFIPVGVVKELYVYPIKSCKGISVFSFFCHRLGPVFGENFDRYFIVICGKTGRLHSGLRTDGLDCGDEAAEFFSKAIEESDVRLLMYTGGLFNERTCIPNPAWWNNNVPKRIDNCAYADLAPYMLTTQASLDDLNSKLESDVSNLNFRPVIVVDKCEAWDEDKWLDLQIGAVRLQCFKPCTRCILTTVNPATGSKDGGMQPLKKLRQFRLAPEGRMRDQFKDSPIFGVNAGVDKPGYIHVGQTVYARYKKSPF